VSFLSCEEMLAAARSQNISLSEAILRSDLAESRLTEAHSREMMHHLWQVMQATSRDYDPAQRSRSGLSGGDAAKVEQAHQEGKSLGGDYLAAVTAEALKTAECNACMKRIVAAPTAGSCGVLPAVLLPLARFAMEVYENSPCKPYQPKVMQNSGVTERDVLLMAQMHKAISVIQFKIEGQMIKRHPEYKMEGRALLEKIDYEKGTIEIDGKDYPLKDADFPTVDPRDPYKLTPGEDQLIRTLQASFLNSDKLQKHIRLLFSKGSMYLIVNSNLMYHASIPMTDEGEFKTVIVDGKPYAGRSLLDKLDRLTREAYFGGNGAKSQQMALDYMWYLWCGPESPFFDKAKMATLERYLIEDKKTHHEEKGAYYKHLDDTKMCSMILSAFGLDPEKSHIISGHVPVKTCKGESPIKAGGKLLMIDGGFSKAYHSETGIAGYTLIYNSHGLQLVQHEPFESAVKAVEEGKDIISTKVIVEATTDRITVRDTTIGKELQVQIDDLKNLLAAYRSGQIKERK
jgi:fructose-1,6-bisphosphatase-3